MARRPYVFTARRAQALEKARLKSAAVRHAKAHKVGHAPSPVNRGQGRKGLGANFTPYARVNKRGATAGVNTGTIIPGTKKRVSLGGYVRVEGVNRKGAIDRVNAKVKSKVFPVGSRRGKAYAGFKNNVTIKNPYQVRASVKGHQVRLGTSRGAGPTLIVRRGKHKTPSKKSKVGVNAYKKSASSFTSNKIKAKKRRPQRRIHARTKRI